jgi:tryptophanyl-tRNA synthetase
MNEADLQALRKRYTDGGLGYKEAKEMLLANVLAFITPIRTKREELENNKTKVLEILKEGGKKIKEITKVKMQTVRNAVGVDIYEIH